eukprot:3833400-Pyramimonas_sp.AAC.1
MTNLRFADGNLLIGHSWQHIVRALSKARRSAASVGLLLHPDKTKIITNATRGTGRGKGAHAAVVDMQIEIAPLANPVKFLGERAVFEKPVETALEHRLHQGWKAPMANKEELNSKKCSLRCRLHLCESAATPAALRGSSSWALS